MHHAPSKQSQPQRRIRRHNLAKQPHSQLLVAVCSLITGVIGGRLDLRLAAVVAPVVGRTD
eukprot:2742799-Prymnesium_polylepis.1